MLELTWKLFCQTGNIEAYLLLKELEGNQTENTFMNLNDSEERQLDTNM